MLSACESLKKLCEAGRKEDAGDNNSISGLVALAAQQALEVFNYNYTV